MRVSSKHDAKTRGSCENNVTEPTVRVGGSKMVILA